MAHREPAPRPERQILAHPPVLGEQGRRPVEGGGGAQRRVADGLAADLRGGQQVALEQPRRDGEDVADVVEAVARLVGRQEGLGVDVEGQDVADGVGVLGPVQPLHGRPSRIGSGFGRAVEGGLQIRGEGGVGRGVGARPRSRRHGRGAQFPQHLLPDRGVVADVRRVDGVEGEAGGEGAGVVAGDAVAVQHCAGGDRFGRGDGRRLRPDAAAGRCPGEAGEARDADDPSRAACHSLPLRRHGRGSVATPGAARPAVPTLRPALPVIRRPLTAAVPPPPRRRSSSARR